MNYVSIKAALRFIPKPLFKYWDEPDFLSAMLDAYRELDLPAIYENKIKIYEIDNGKIQLEDDVKEINLITYMSSVPNSSDWSSFTDCICNADSNANTEDTNNPCQYTIAYKQFLASTYYKNNYSPLLYKGNGDFLCKTCPNKFSSCQNVFTIDQNKVLHTNLTSGFLCVDYASEITSGDDFLIIDLTEIKRYLAFAAMAKQWEERAALKEQNAKAMYDDALTKAEIYFKKCRGILLMRGINPQDINSVQYAGYQYFLKLPETQFYAR